MHLGFKVSIPNLRYDIPEVFIFSIIIFFTTYFNFLFYFLLLKIEFFSAVNDNVFWTFTTISFSGLFHKAYLFNELYCLVISLVFNMTPSFFSVFEVSIHFPIWLLPSLFAITSFFASPLFLSAFFFHEASSIVFIFKFEFVAYAILFFLFLLTVFLFHERTPLFVFH